MLRGNKSLFCSQPGLWLSKMQSLNNPSKFSLTSQLALNQSIWKWLCTSLGTFGQAAVLKTAACSLP